MMFGYFSVLLGNYNVVTLVGMVKKKKIKNKLKAFFFIFRRTTRKLASIDGGFHRQRYGKPSQDVFSRDIRSSRECAGFRITVAFS